MAGRMKVLSYLESPEVLHDLSGLFVGRSVSEAVLFPLVAVQVGKGSFILQLGGIEDREAAARLQRIFCLDALRKDAETPGRGVLLA